MKSIIVTMKNLVQDFISTLYFVIKDTSTKHHSCLIVINHSQNNCSVHVSSHFFWPRKYNLIKICVDYEIGKRLN